MVACHQFVPMLEPGAIGNHTLETQRTLREAGMESEIFAQLVDPTMVGRARHYEEYGSEYQGRRDDTLLYQFGIGSVVAFFLRDRPERKVVHYHNLTPTEMLAGWNPEIVPGMQWGHRQLLELATSVDFAMADSSFNRNDLRDAGYRDVEVVPAMVDLDAFEREIDETADRRIQADRAGGGCDLLFVGRVAPNKCQHDLIKVLAAYRRGYDARARLRIVGGSASDRYYEALRAFAHEAGVGDAVDFAGHVTAGELSAYYRGADVFVCASEHEGFGVPLLEAMHHGTPIVAYAAAAVPETLGGGGVLLRSKAPAEFASAIHAVQRDPAFRAQLVAAGNERLADFELGKTRQRFLDALARHGIGGA